MIEIWSADLSSNMVSRALLFRTAPHLRSSDPSLVKLPKIRNLEAS